MLVCSQEKLLLLKDDISINMQGHEAYDMTIWLSYNVM